LNFDPLTYVRQAAQTPTQKHDGGTPAWPPPLDLVTLAGQEPRKPAFIIDDWLPAGYATMLAGHGGAGKSSIALYLMVCIALGLDWFGKPTARRRILYLSCEDRADVLHWRLSRICRHLGVDLADLDGWLDIVDLVGCDTILWRHDPTGWAPTTPAFDALRHQFRNTGTELVVVDGVSDTFGGNENDRGQVKAYINSLLSLSDPERGAVLLLGHVNKPTASASNATEGYSGSTQWHNAVRARWYLYPETSQDDEDDAPRKSGDLRLQLQKSNLGRTDQEIGFRWCDEARLFVAKREESGALGAMREKGERQSIVDALAHCEANGIEVPAAT